MADTENAMFESLEYLIINLRILCAYLIFIVFLLGLGFSAVEGFGSITRDKKAYKIHQSNTPVHNGGTKSYGPYFTHAVPAHHHSKKK